MGILIFNFTNTRLLLVTGFDVDIAETSGIALFWFIALSGISFIRNTKIFAGTYLRADDNIENNQMFCYSFNKKTSKNHFEGSPVPSFVNADHADDLM